MADYPPAGPYLSLDWSRNVGGDVLALGTADGQIRLQDAESGDVVLAWSGVADRVSAVAWSPDGTRLASGGDDGTVRLWVPADDVVVADEFTGQTADVWALAWSPDGGRLASAGADSAIRLWDATSGEVSELTGHTSGVRSVAWSPDGRLASAGEDGTIRISDLATGTVRVLRGHTGGVRAVAWSPDGDRLASAGHDRTVRLWDAASGTAELTRRTNGVLAVAWSPDGVRLASAGADRTVLLWDLTAGTVTALTGHTGGVRAVAWSPDGRRLASASSDRSVRLWDPGIGAAPRTGHAGDIATAAWSPDGIQLATAVDGGMVRLWDSTTGTNLTEFGGGPTGAISTIAWSPDGTQLATAGEDSTVRLWDPTTGTNLTEFGGGPTGAISTIAWSPDGTQLATAGEDSTVRLWDPTTGTNLTEFGGGPTGAISTIAWSPDGTRLATAGEDSTVHLWDPTTGTNLARLVGHTGGVWAVAWSHDGTRLASAGADRTIHLWDPTTGTSTARLVGHTAGVWAVAWSPDGTRLASAGADRTIHLWDPTTGTSTARLVGHTAAVWAVAWSPDGTRLASAGADRTIHLWDPTSETSIGQFPLTGRDRPAAGTTRLVDSVRQGDDSATTTDRLGRSYLAAGLAGQLLEMEIGRRKRNEVAESFAANITGPWGSGKSSLANFLLLALRGQSDADAWVLPKPNHFLDAWRESQIGPAWWSLLTWLRRTTCNAQPWHRRHVFRLRELLHRLSLSGLIWPTVSIAGLAAAFVVIVVYRAPVDDQLRSGQAVVALSAALVAAAATAAAAGAVLGRWLTWRTPAGARLFQRRDDNPMEAVISHSTWLRRRLRGPVLLVIDDLDRCPAAFVVEVLEAVQTLLRGTLTVRGEGTRRPAQPLVVVVCADERWLHAAFECHYGEFAGAVDRPGSQLGELFLAKLFQLRLRVPDLDPAAAVAFGRIRLGLDSTSSLPHAAPARNPTRSPPLRTAEAAEQIKTAPTLEAKLRVLDRVEANEGAQQLAVDIGRFAVSAEGQQHLEHELEPYVSLLARIDPSPRAVVRYLNVYAIARMSVSGRASVPTVDDVARWTIVELSWPAVARRLSANPALLDAWYQHGVDADDPDRAVLCSAGFHRVVLDEEGLLVLDSAVVRRCLGLAPTKDDARALDSEPDAEVNLGRPTVGSTR